MPNPWDNDPVAKPSNPWDNDPVVGVPDTAPLQRTVQDNLAAHQANDNEDGTEKEPLGPEQKLDTGLGFPATSVLKGGDHPMTPDIRGHIVDAYKKGTAISAGDYMQSALPAAAAAARGAEQAAIPSVAGFAAFAPGAAAGAEMAAIPAAASGPFAPLVEGAGALIGGVLTSMGGSYATAVGQKAFLEKNPQIAERIGLSNEQLIKDATEHPTASFAGGLAPNLLFMRPGSAVVRLEDGTTKKLIFGGVKKMALGAALGAGQETGREAASGEPLDPEKIALSTIMTAITNKETQLGSAISSRTMAGYEALKPIVSSIVKKPAAAVTPEDINQVIAKSFGAAAPTAQHFEDTAKVMGVPVDSLHEVYKQTGIAPDQVFADAQSNPDVMRQLMENKVPDIYGQQEAPIAAGAHDETEIEANKPIQNTPEAVESTGHAASLSSVIPQSVREFGSEIKNDILSFTTPMETGSPRAQAVAKDFANNLRWAQWNGSRTFKYLTDNYSPAELEKMWNAMDEASVHAQTLEANGMSREEAMSQTERDKAGHFGLPEDQQEIIKNLSRDANESFQQAKKLGMVEGEGLPFWTPRMAAVIGEDGAWQAPSGEGKPSIDVGKNLRTTSSNLLERKYLTAAETEEAMKAVFAEQDKEAALVRDIRAMPLALSRLQQAIAGRSMIDEISKMSSAVGMDTVSSVPREGFFTLDHPAFYKYKPRLYLSNETAKYEVLKDQNGDPIFDKEPIYVSEEFRGPLEAVLSNDSGATYKALMTLKGKSLGLIMYSPAIHLGVEYGRALPAMPGKINTIKFWTEGNRAKNDPTQMKEAINAGLVPIGARFFNQDITSIMEEPSLTAGRSWTAKLLGGLTGTVSKKGGLAVKRAIDRAGDFYHNTLLWDRIGDLQMGLYTNMRDDLVKSGMDPKGAQASAAHMANRFAGALPMESMSNAARKIANVTMFSRSFTIGNLGVMKDMFKGLPSDVTAQLERDIGKEGAEKASSATKRKARAAFALDIALLYAGNSIVQDTLDYLLRDKSLSQIEQGYVDRWNKAMKKYSEQPWDLLSPTGAVVGGILGGPMGAGAGAVGIGALNALSHLSSTSENEPGKENRIHWYDDPKTGTAAYLRLPTGKIGEEFIGWNTDPAEMVRKKGSTIFRPMMDVMNNADYFGNPIYDQDARGFAGTASNMGKVVTHLMEAQIPEDSIVGAYNALTGSNDKTLDYMKVAGPLAGITFSKGYPGGPEAGILAAANRRQEAQIVAALPSIKSAVEADDTDKARKIMSDLHMEPGEQRRLIEHYQNPAGKVNTRSMNKFKRIATPEEKELMEKQQQ